MLVGCLRENRPTPCALPERGAWDVGIEKAKDLRDPGGREARKEGRLWAYPMLVGGQVVEDRRFRSASGAIKGHGPRRREGVLVCRAIALSIEQYGRRGM